MKIHYRQFIKIDDILMEIKELDLDTDEKKSCLELIDDIFYHKMLEKILSELKNEEDKIVFLRKAVSEPVEEAVEFLREKVASFEEKVSGDLNGLRGEIIEDLRALRRI
ncbi:MAG: hypothetical protein A2Y57_03285 [Candidatus Woykebacteria bacterium RBG_13_40_7b]|uniref:Uncharacterized protein n=1 Tax=Candidatus Woykebacteria bacterium RBG_13_40_7b TaxID=1802594 RepID=A0A1G1WB45_9BACT|nr:MAG: hypothetical protein A2Y57_03285 [Candidatus Woykebacteria bacterium RBG_13_40_7b]